MARVITKGNPPTKPTVVEADVADLEWLDDLDGYGGSRDNSAATVSIKIEDMTDDQLRELVRKKSVLRLEDRINFLETGEARTVIQTNRKTGEQTVKEFGKNSRANYFKEVNGRYMLSMKYGTRIIKFLIKRDKWEEAYFVDKKKYTEELEIEIWKRVISHIGAGLYDKLLMEAAKEIASNRGSSASDA